MYRGSLILLMLGNNFQYVKSQNVDGLPSTREKCVKCIFIKIIGRDFLPERNLSRQSISMQMVKDKH